MNYVGIIPAAGLASRLGPLGYPKELLPITYVQGEGGHLRPLPVIEASLRQLRTADVDRCMVITSERKPELAQYLGGGGAIGLDIAYVQQTRAEGPGRRGGADGALDARLGQLPAAARHHRAAAGCPEDHARDF